LIRVAEVILDPDAAVGEMEGDNWAFNIPVMENIEARKKAWCLSCYIRKRSTLTVSCFLKTYLSNEQDDAVAATPSLVAYAVHAN
jgi:hypothetical protein